MTNQIKDQPICTAPSGNDATLVQTALGITKQLFLNDLKTFVGGGAGASYEFTQSSPSISWTVNHNLGAYPAIQVLSPGGVLIEAGVVHVSLNQSIISFASAQAGKAICK